MLAENVASPESVPTDRQTERLKDRKTARKADRKTGRQT